MLTQNGWRYTQQPTLSTSTFTVKALHGLIARFGIPRCIVSDNAANFTCREFQAFIEKFHIKHMTSPPYFPQSNDAAENAVRTIKNALKRALVIICE